MVSAVVNPSSRELTDASLNNSAGLTAGFLIGVNGEGMGTMARLVCTNWSDASQVPPIPAPSIILISGKPHHTSATGMCPPGSVPGKGVYGGTAGFRTVKLHSRATLSLRLSFVGARFRGQLLFWNLECAVYAPLPFAR
jgi:hypothetical protein